LETLFLDTRSLSDAEAARSSAGEDPAVRAQAELMLLLGLPLMPAGPPYTAASLAEAMQAPELPATIYAPRNEWTGRPLSVPVEAASDGQQSLTRKLSWRLAPAAQFSRTEALLVKGIERAAAPPVVWTFGELPIDIMRRLKARHVKLVREKFNCAKAVASEILLAEHAKLGLPPPPRLSAESIAREAEELELSDAVFCPSPMVAKSLRRIGIPEAKLLPTSYGWEPGRFAGSTRMLAPAAGVTLVFVGQICVRKGAHVLLEAWVRAGIEGRLLLAGRIDRDIQTLCKAALARPDVHELGFVSDIGSVFRSADWFVFPTLEEGGPQVTYEAAACDLPSIVTPMGAGAFTRDGLDGIVIDSNDPDRWAEVIRSLPARPDERAAMAASARAHADEFTWDKVGARRRAQMISLASSPPTRDAAGP
jgi:glycosyltransferase involved in cell wall biosynthesis